MKLTNSFREKGHWEDRIKELGGADYKSSGAKVLDSQGTELPGSGGYKYFGAAKDLPGVRELFQSDVPTAPKKNRQDLYRNINFAYYGINDEENEDMLIEEKEYEQTKFNEALDEWVSLNQDLIQKRLKDIKEPTKEDIFKLIDEDTIESFRAQHETNEVLHKNYKNEVKEDEQKKIIEQKKKALLGHYFPNDESDDEKAVKQTVYEKY